MRVFLETEDGAIAKDGLVQNLEEVDPDEDDQDDGVGLPADALVVFVGQGDAVVAYDGESLISVLC